MANIVIIDDDDDDSDLLREAIHQVRPDANCFIAHSASEVMESFKQNELPLPDLIFLDLNMPRISGVQCLRELKGHPELSFTPVAIYTSSKSPQERVETLQFGASYFFTKPSNFRGMCRIVTDLFAKEMFQ
jgi:DNA-binding response OmpR family regulator